jgi:hypothetical protein
MTLTDEDKKRIQEEEAYRAQVRAAQAEPAKPVKRTGCLIFFVIVIGFFIFVSIIGKLVEEQENKIIIQNTSSRTTKSAETLQLKQGDTFRVGSFSYIVDRAQWLNSVGSHAMFRQSPDAKFLAVLVIAKNVDNTPRTIPPFYLVDDKGAEHEVSPHWLFVEKPIGVLDTINPSVQKEGIVLFDVPEGRQYKLKVSGGYWSSGQAFVELNPK